MLKKNDKSNGESFKRTDSFRKVLPSKPSSTVDSRLSMSMKMIERPVAVDISNRGNKMFMPYMLEYALMAEYIMLQKVDLSGIFVMPSDQDPLVWFGIIFVKQGLYQGGVFRFQLHFPDNFPDGPCPKVVFESRVYHPAVNIETGELNVSGEFKEWKRKVNHVWQVLQYIRRIFYTIDARATDNKAASELCNLDNQKFRQLVQECVEESRAKIYERQPNDDFNYLHFGVFNESLNDPIKEQLLNSLKEEPESLT
ncbi:UNVERIFIED_CONTAM: hypothetical protein PYX00_006787 [Menopon gallinae]|uniref:UBC core domain-containing protein n=1 Tax=Menopon gallinae TaxID=328185 RepID=A0AAW2HXB3_9NEOP